MTDKADEQASITLGPSNSAEPDVTDFTSSASPYFMHTVLWAPPEINQLVFLEDTLRHKLDTWQAGNLHLTWTTTTSGIAVSLFVALCTTSMPAFTQGVFVTLTLIFFIIACITGLKWRYQHKTSDQIVDELKQTLTRQSPTSFNHHSTHTPHQTPGLGS